jgi:hypothetical protein
LIGPPYAAAEAKRPAALLVRAVLLKQEQRLGSDLSN